MAIFLPWREGLLVYLSRIGRCIERHEACDSFGDHPLRGTEKAFGIFYEFSTIEIPRANGFSLTTGISTLSCQVSGMNLDYSGPLRDRPQANK